MKHAAFLHFLVTSSLFSFGLKHVTQSWPYLPSSQQRDKSPVTFILHTLFISILFPLKAQTQANVFLWLAALWTFQNKANSKKLACTYELTSTHPICKSFPPSSHHNRLSEVFINRSSSQRRQIHPMERWLVPERQEISVFLV